LLKFSLSQTQQRIINLKVIINSQSIREKIRLKQKQLGTTISTPKSIPNSPISASDSCKIRFNFEINSKNENTANSNQDIEEYRNLIKKASSWVKIKQVIWFNFLIF
jgi:hypothetical protein